MAGIALGFALEAGLEFFALKIADTFRPAPYSAEAVTSVQIITGGGGKMTTGGGQIPHIALFDDLGQRIGQFHPGKKDYIAQSNVQNVPIIHTLTKPQYAQADPYYIMLSQLSDDAVCIAAITVSGSKISGAFYGDTGYICGQSWFPSETRIGASFEAPRCVWLDGNHNNGINARAISFHLNDMQPNDDKMDQYYENRDSLCKSTPRYSFWGNLLPDAIPPFFIPPLKYKNGNGADEDLSKVIDDPNAPYDKGAYMNPKKGGGKASRRVARAGKYSSNHDPTHLIISDQNTNVREVCESTTSYGWDIVSTTQNLFCDMEHKRLYPLCDATITSECFDLEQKTLVGTPSLDQRDETVKKLRFGRSYNTTSIWTL